MIGFVWQQTARNLLRVPDRAPERGAADAAQRRRAPRARARAPRTCWRGSASADRGEHRPERLSGGEQQRVAIAVALANQPAVLFADEPTGELDTATAHEVFELLRTVNHELGVTIVVVTHDPLVSEQVSRTIAIRDGRTSTETLRRRADHRRAATTTSSARSTRSSIASGGCSCRAPTSKRWVSSGASG